MEDITLPVNRVRQERSRKTLEKIASAVEALLKEKSFEEMTIAEISRAAGVTSGAIYARFPSKNAILPLIYQRYDAWSGALADEEFGREPWPALEFAEAIERVVAIFIRLYKTHRGLTRAMALFARSHPDLVPPSAPQRRGAFIRNVVTALAPHKDRIGDSWKERTAFATYAVATVARESIVFGYAPLAGAAHLDERDLTGRLILLFRGCLCTPAEDRPGENRE